MTPWRFCNKCFVMFFDGNEQKGRCAGSGNGHQAQGLTFNLPHDVPESDHDQAHWRFCNKCATMFFHGSSENGTCPAGGGHETHSKNNYVLHHDVPEDFPVTQGAWRFCSRCSALFFDGFAEKGTCPAGGPHESAGFVFVLPTTEHRIDD